MNSKNKITSLCVHDSKNKYKTIGVIHIHSILAANVPINEQKNYHKIQLILLSIIIIILCVTFFTYFNDPPEIEIAELDEKQLREE